jgi:hypothetical protein
MFILFSFWYLCITTKHGLQVLCNEVPRRVKCTHNLGHYTRKNSVVYAVYLVQHHYFICPQSLVTSHWFLTLYITPTHSPPVCIFLYDEYICYKECHQKLKIKVSLCATSIWQNYLQMHEKVLGSRFHFRQKKNVQNTCTMCS